MGMKKRELEIGKSVQAQKDALTLSGTVLELLPNKVVVRVRRADGQEFTWRVGYAYVFPPKSTGWQPKGSDV